MIVKTFRAPTIEEALAKVKATIGDSALIIDTRKVRPAGPLGFLRKHVVEIVVGIDDVPPAPAGTPPPHWARELADLRAIERDIQAIKEALSQHTSPAPGPAGELTARLVERGVDEPTARALADACRPGDGEGDLEGRLRAAIARRFRTAEPPAPAARGPRVLALVGPPGVGKTTTLAKLAGRLIVGDGARVALASVDFFRVGALEQLRAYAEILSAPFHAIAEPGDAGRVLEAAAAAQWLLVDTPGLPHHDAEQLGQLRAYLAALPAAERHLLLSAAADGDAALASIEAYRTVGFGRVAFTKLDEAPRHGLLLRAAEAAGVPVSYLADGQDVAAHLEAARPERLADLVIGAVAEHAGEQGA